MYDRLINLYNVDYLKNKRILLVGVGGVGSACFEALIRSGILNITICDYDVYEESNLNRQLHSSLNNIGTKKTLVLKEYAKNINPMINVEIIDEFLDSNSQINFNNYDYIIDACDSIDAKVLLIKNAYSYNIPIIVSLGVGNRLNPEDLRVTKLSKITGDPLAKKLRHELKNIEFKKDIKVVGSNELPIKSNPVNSFVGVSASAGILLATYVIKELSSGN